MWRAQLACRSVHVCCWKGKLHGLDSPKLHNSCGLKDPNAYQRPGLAAPSSAARQARQQPVSPPAWLSCSAGLPPPLPAAVPLHERLLLLPLSAAGATGPQVSTLLPAGRRLQHQARPPPLARLQQQGGACRARLPPGKGLTGTPRTACDSLLLLHRTRQRCRERLGGQAGAAHRAGCVLGQPQGDALLVEVVAALREGGDDFAILIICQAHCAAGALILSAIQGQPMALSVGAGSFASNTRPQVEKPSESAMRQGG